MDRYAAHTNPDPAATSHASANRRHPLWLRAVIGWMIAIWPRITLVTPVYNGIVISKTPSGRSCIKAIPTLNILSSTAVPPTAPWTSFANTRNTFPGGSAGETRVFTMRSIPASRNPPANIMGWLNASDLLHTSGLFVVGSVFASLPSVEWLTGPAYALQS